MREHLPAERQDWTGGEQDADDREPRTPLHRGQRGRDLDTLATMLRDDVRFSMPPTQGLLIGRDAVLADWVAGGFTR